MKKSLPILFLFALLLSCSGNENGLPDIIVEDPVDNPVEEPEDNPVDNPPDGGPEEPQTNLVPCENGLAGAYPCQGFDLLGRVPLSTLSASAGNDIWGWTDPGSSREFALVGLNNGTAFIEITDTENLVYLGKLPTATSSSSWRDIKVYGDYAFVGSEATGHGMQVFDLKKLLSVANPPVMFSEDTRFTGFGNSHNIVVNEDTGFAYAVGTNRGDQYNGGVHFVNIQDPLNPVAAGGYGDSGYTHDAQVVLYNGPDLDYAGREIFIGANEDAMVVVDVTDKQNPVPISSISYANLGYTHQGWFTEDQRYLILGDELDEINFGFNSRTLVFDLFDLDAPFLHTTYTGTTAAIDHNGYVKGNDYYLANYTAGIRVLDITDLSNGVLAETGYFDSFPSANSASFNGVWSVYPYFESGKIVFNDINSGFFVVRQTN
jgi:choice-of-anchor B domain-containing protein